MQTNPASTIDQFDLDLRATPAKSESPLGHPTNVCPTWGTCYGSACGTC